MNFNWLLYADDEEKSIQLIDKLAATNLHVDCKIIFANTTNITSAIGRSTAKGKLTLAKFK